MHEGRGAAPPVLTTLLHAAAEAQGRLESKLSAIGLSGAKLAALSVLREAGESLPLGQLAERLSCVKSNITQLVDRLEADGLVRRLLDPNDRRTRLAALTAAGRAASEQGLLLQAEAERELVSGLDPAEASLLTGLIARLHGGS